MTMKIIPILLSAILCTNAFASPRTFVSAASGNDLNPCSRTSPCRSFAGALAVTDADGEIIVVDSGGYGPVTIAQSVSIVSPAGIYAGVTVMSGVGIVINAGDTGRVVLRNLALIAQGTATSAIDADTVSTLSIENCTISGFTTNGILFDPTTANSSLAVTRTIIRNIPSIGINITGGSQSTNGATATIDSVHLYDCRTGVFVTYALASISNTIAAGGLDNGYFAYIGSKVSVSESVATNNGTGFTAGFGFMMVSRCEATSNTTGIGAYEFGVIDVSDSTIALNTTGLYEEALTVISSRGNNTLQANTTDGAFNQSYSAQ